MSQPFTVNINFNELVTGLELSDFVINNGVVSNLFGSGNVYSVDVTPTTFGNVSLNLPTNVVMDAAGNGNLASNILNVDFQQPPNSTGPDLELSMTSNVDFSPIFSNVVFTIELTNVGVAAANNIAVDVPFPANLPYVGHETTDGDFNVSFRRWNLSSLAPGGSATLTLTLFTLVGEDVPVTLYGQVTAASPQDDDSTPNNGVCQPDGVFGCIPSEDDEASVTLNVAEAPDNPSVELTTPTSSVSGPFEVSIDFSRVVTGLTLSDFSISNGSGSNLSGSGSMYTISITPNLSGDVTVTLPANSVVDGDNNGNLVSNQLFVNFSAPPGNETDLQLTMTSMDTGFDQNDFLTISLRVENTSTVDASNLVIEYPKPGSTAFTSLSITNGTYADFTGEWVIGNLPAGGVEVLEVTWFTLTGAETVDVYAQVQTASPNDIDSTPGNGTCCIPNEDDEASLSFDSNISATTSSPNSTIVPSRADQNEHLQLLPPFPNPTVDRLNLRFYVPASQALNVQLQNVLGEVVFKANYELSEEIERRIIDLSQLPSGVYYLTTDQKGKRAPIPVFKSEF